MLEFRTFNADETRALGERLAPLMNAGDLIALVGELGTGKTCFAQGIAKGLGISEPIVSPSFTIVNEYRGRLPFYHFDVYRISPRELDELGYQEYFYGDGLVVVEWADKIEDRLPRLHLRVELKLVVDIEMGAARDIRFLPRGAYYKEKLQLLQTVT